MRRTDLALTFGEERDEGVSACPAAARVRLRQHDVNLGLAFGNQGDPTATVEDGVASKSHAERVAVEGKRGAGIHRAEVDRSQ